ncbi:MAG: HDIG domain-containing metalloprotein [Planctomycetota bacterium]
MSSGNKQRNNKQRIDNLGIETSKWSAWWRDGDKSDTVVRVTMAVLAAVVLLLACETWKPPFAFREGAIPARDLVTRITFDVPDEDATKELRERKRREINVYYVNRTKPLDQLRGELANQLFLITSAPTFEELTPDAKAALDQLVIEGDDAKEWDARKRFDLLKAIAAVDTELVAVKGAVRSTMQEYIEAKGVLDGLKHSASEGDQQVIFVYQEGVDDSADLVSVEDVRIAKAGSEMIRFLRERFRSTFNDGKVQDPDRAAEMIGNWIVARLPDFQTLSYDAVRSEQVRQQKAADVAPVLKTYVGGEATLAEAGTPIDVGSLDLLRREWRTLVGRMNWHDRVLRIGAYAGMMIALYLLCGFYIYFVGDRNLILDHVQFGKLLVVMIGILVAGYWLSGRAWRTELVPLTIGSILCGVVYKRELAMLLMAAVCIALTLFLGGDVSELVVMIATCCSIVLLMGRIRTRTRLLSVGAISALITIATVFGVGIVTGNTLSAGASGPGIEATFRGVVLDSVLTKLAIEALLGGFLICAASAAMTPFLPLVERGFGVQTDLSLLELGDASHALLRRLAQLAPGTYNHSINVASIAEAAADEIGANGLLVRVGAYFHDIGKMFKPEYFIENQTVGENQHDSLQPAMSKLVIIAHVKDGADLARKHKLPVPIIDLILQHHGTTVVEYFFREAARRSEEDPNGESVSDKDFRYPGPKPQTLEAAVMMLADTVESASRTLVDPTPQRIRNLVDAIAEKKMADGQFDECSMTFKQLDQIRTSLVKSLTAIYHARIKYPSQSKSA